MNSRIETYNEARRFYFEVSKTTDDALGTLAAALKDLETAEAALTVEDMEAITEARFRQDVADKRAMYGLSDYGMDR